MCFVQDDFRGNMRARDATFKNKLGCLHTSPFMRNNRCVTASEHDDVVYLNDEWNESKILIALSKQFSNILWILST